MIRAKNGVKDVKTPDVPLSIFVCAIGYRKYGITLPTIPEINKIRKSFFLTSFIFLAKKGNKIIAAKDNRSAPISRGCSEINDFLINFF